MGTNVLTLILVGLTATEAVVSKIVDRMNHNKMIEKVAEEITKKLEIK